MTDPEHLRIPNQGVKAFNEWRKDNFGIKLNLIKANLSGANLSGANLSGAKLLKANLNGTNLSGANLKNTDISGANLKANLKDTNLRGADLHGVNLKNTDLREAKLGGADLSGQDLSGHDLSQMDLSGTNLSGANLKEANLSYINLSRSDISGANITGANLYKWKIEGIKCTNIFWKNKRVEFTNPQDFEKAFTEIESVVELLLDLPFSDLTYYSGLIIQQAINKKFGEGTVIFKGQNAVSNDSTNFEFLSDPEKFLKVSKKVSELAKELNIVIEEAKSKNDHLPPIGFASEIPIPFTGGAIVIRAKELEKTLTERFVQMNPLLQKIIQTTLLHIR